MVTVNVPEVAGKQIIAREHKHNVHDQIQDQKQTLPSWRNGTPADWILAVLAESGRKKQALSNPQTHAVRLRSVLTAAVSSCGQEL